VTVETLLAVLWARGVQLEAVGDRLRFRPPAAVSPALRAALVAHKAAVLAHLRVAMPELPLGLPAQVVPRRVSASGRDSRPRERGGLCPRRVAEYIPCLGCGNWAWIFYGVHPLCRLCAEQVDPTHE
jgi:TubC N-terminal docking domain